MRRHDRMPHHDDVDRDVDDLPGAGSRLLGGMLAGALAGLVAGYVADRLLDTLDSAARAKGVTRGPYAVTPLIGVPGARVAQAISEKAGHALTPEEARYAAPVVHYLSCAAAGAVYGGVAEFAPWVAAGVGTAFGAGLFVGVDLVALPSLGVAEPPAAEPPVLHGRRLAARLAFGAVTDVVRRVLRLVRG